MSLVRKGEDAWDGEAGYVPSKKLGIRGCRMQVRGERVKNINQAYQQLWSETRGRLTKVKTLEMAIQLIRYLTDELQRLRSEPQHDEIL